jgi:F-type H+-transporting ATPase subunit delta
MPSRASAARYAKALLDVALNESDPARIEQELSAFADLLSSNAELYGALTNPGVPLAGKAAVTDAVSSRLELSSPVRKLLSLLAERDRMALVPDLLVVYRERLMEHQQVVRAEVTTATPLSPRRATQIQERLARITGRRVDITTSVDPAIIGGMVARIGSTVYDGSVATQLSKLHQRLAQRS